MFRSQWLHNLCVGLVRTRKDRRRQASRPRRGVRLEVERLESRIVPSITLQSAYSGISFANSSVGVPPDTQGAAGTTNYVQTTNQEIAIFGPKNTGTSQVSDSLANFWYTQGRLSQADAGSHLSDPNVVWDEQIQRFIVGDQDVNNTTHVSTFDIAVSKSASPATLTRADWNFFQVKTTEKGYNADYPGNLGWNHDALVFTLDMLNPANGLPNHVQVNSININALVKGTPLTNGINAFQTDFSGMRLRPTVMHDSKAGDPMWFVQAGANNASINVVKMTNVLSSKPTFTTTTLAVNPYYNAVPELQPNGTAITTKTISDIEKAAMQKGLIVAAQTVSDAAGNLDAIQWYVINATGAKPALQQQGDISGGPGTYYAYPGIDINAQGDIGVSYIASGTSPGQYMSTYITGRTPNDPTGTMETPVLVQAGQGNYADPTGGREGDLSGINVDSNGSFWITNEYANTDAIANWGTTIAHFTVNNITLLSDYSGISVANSGGAPPDTQGAAGTTSYVETAGGTIAIFDPKNTGANQLSDSMANFLYNQGGLSQADAGSHLSDPVSLWDEQIQRFIVGMQDVNNTTHVSTFDIAVSKSANPATLTSADWYFFQVNTSEKGYNADYPGNLGWNHDALVFTLGMLPATGGNTYKHIQINSININALVSGTPLVEGVNAFQKDFTTSNLLRPTVMHDSKAGDPMWFVQSGDNGGASISIVKMTNVLSSTPTFTTTTLAVNPYFKAVPELQPNGTAITTNTDSRIMKAAMQKGLIVAAHQVSDAAGNLDAIQWYVINTTGAKPALQQQGDISGGPGTYYAYPGIDINAQGDIGVSYIASGTSPGQYMSMYITGRILNDPKGTMETPILIQAGQTNDNRDGREGDMSGINVASDGSFWVSNEFANTDLGGSWGTTIANFTMNKITLQNTFPGISFPNSGYPNSRGAPPDTQGAAGPLDYVETVNQAIAIYNKNTGETISTTSLADFLYTQGGLPQADAGSHLSDPAIVWDEQIQRFIVGDQDVNNTTQVSTFDIAVSKSANPATLTSADWNFFQVNTTQRGFNADYPGNLGWNSDALVFTLDMLNPANGLPDHIQINSININTLATGARLITVGANANAFQNIFAGTSLLRPTVMHDSKADDPMWFVQANDNGGNTINVVKMTNVLSSTPIFNTTTLAVNPYSKAVPELQPNGTAITTNTDSRILKAAMQNGLIVAAQTVSDAAGNLDEIQWYVINTNFANPVLQQQGDISGGQGTYYAYPGIDINAQGAIGVSFIASGTNPGQYMSTYITGWNPNNDPIGMMKPPVLVQAGLANYSDPYGGREGDMSGISVDPNGNSFWIANEYANTDATANWGTVIANFTVNRNVIVQAAGVFVLFAPNDPTVILSAAVTDNSDPSITVNEGTVAFTVENGSTIIGIVQGTVSDGTANADFALPAGQPAGSYTIAVSYTDSFGNFTDGGDIGATLTITPDNVTTTANTVSTTYNPNSQTVTLSATIDDASIPNAIVNEGTVTFDVAGIGTVQGTVSGGTASANIVVPAGEATGTYAIAVSYTDSSGDFIDGGDTPGTLTIFPPLPPPPPPCPPTCVSVATAQNNMMQAFSQLISTIESDIIQFYDLLLHIQEQAFLATQPPFSPLAFGATGGGESFAAPLP
ncbi:MAG: hypothetical protein ACYC3I_09785 [Gemmataceae bacterium]